MFVVQATLAILDKLDIETDKPTEEEVAKKFGFEESYHNGEIKRQSTSSFITFLSHGKFLSLPGDLIHYHTVILQHIRTHNNPAAHQDHCWIRTRQLLLYRNKEMKNVQDAAVS